MAGNSGAKKRNSDAIERDRSVIAELMFQGHRPTKIMEIMAERGRPLTISQIQNDIIRIRKNWLDNQDINYGALFLEEHARLDALEQTLWDEFYASSEPKVRITIEKYAKDGLIDEVAAQKIIESKEISGRNIKWVELVFKVQQERRKLWGLYAPEQKEVRNEVIIKGYRMVSPSDWDDDDVVDGEIEEPKQLE